MERPFVLINHIIDDVIEYNKLMEMIDKLYINERELSNMIAKENHNLSIIYRNSLDVFSTNNLPPMDNINRTVMIRDYLKNINNNLNNIKRKVDEEVYLMTIEITQIKNRINHDYNELLTFNLHPMTKMYIDRLKDTINE